MINIYIYIYWIDLNSHNCTCGYYVNWTNIGIYYWTCSKKYWFVSTGNDRRTCIPCILYIRWKSTCIWMYMVSTHCVYTVSHPGSYQSDDDVPIVKSPRKRSRSFLWSWKTASAVIKLILLVLSIGRIPIVVSIVLIFAIIHWISWWLQPLLLKSQVFSEEFRFVSFHTSIY